MGNKSEKPLFTPDELEVSLYDTVEYLDSDEAIIGYFSVCLTEDYDPDFFLAVIADVLRAKGLNTIESLLKIAEEMHPPTDSADVPSGVRTKPAEKKPAKKTTGKKIAAKRVSIPQKHRKKREAAVA